ncbi:MAG: putative exported protein [Devosia sp.]|nr:putative exported protein [Devosia sp.]
MWQRRAFLKAAGVGFAASLLPGRAAALERAELVFASSIETAAGGYAAALVSETGALIAEVALPDRGHDITFSPLTGQAVVFARQPGTFAVVFDPKGKSPPVTLTSIEGRHFYGHGAFSPDGRLLYVTESDYEAARGVIGVYDATGGFARIGEFDTFGTGPHEVLLMPDGRTLAIANGGIETHPDYGRTELNLETMEPSLAFVDAPTGELVGLLKLEAALHQLSIRHLAVDMRNRVWFGCQFRGVSGTPQLVGYATMDGEIRLIELPPDQLGSLRNYVGSVAAGKGGEMIAVSSPEGNTILAIDAATALPISALALDNGCGIAADAVGFMASSGDGELVGFAQGEVTPVRMNVKFDNHLRRVI